MQIEKRKIVRDRKKLSFPRLGFQKGAKTILKLYFLFHIGYRKVLDTSTSRLDTNRHIIKSRAVDCLDAYVMCPLTKRVQNGMVDQATALNFTVCRLLIELMFTSAYRMTL